MRTRAGGILLHITSLPSPFGIGDLGPGARSFIDFLARTGQAYWQFLPLNPTDLARHNSPYVSDSAFAGNPLLISPEGLVDMGFLHSEDIDPPPGLPEEHVDYEAVAAVKSELLGRAFERFEAKGPDSIFERYCAENAFWLEDFARFAALKHHFEGLPWDRWPEEIRRREPDAMGDLAATLGPRIRRSQFEQFLFDAQWRDLRRYARDRGVNFLGDMPIYVHYDSADVWAHPEYFKLDESRRPYAVAGVPPDYFSETGQLWGNPLYDWDALQQDRYRWWAQRFRRCLSLMDFVRIDHFRGLVAYWEVPAEEETAINGQWVEAPVWDFMAHLCRTFPQMPFLAEDLGVITPDVINVIRHFRLPGMKVLLFAFGDDVAKNPFAPHNHEKNCVIYTGTHDNNTVRGWVDHEAGDAVLERVFHYLGRRFSPDEAPSEFIRMALGSVANTAILPMQDVLGLGQEARLNVPGEARGNWAWRVTPQQLGEAPADWLRDLTRTYGRV